jgi:hypothetical protein
MGSSGDAYAPSLSVAILSIKGHMNKFDEFRKFYEHYQVLEYKFNQDYELLNKGFMAAWDLREGEANRLRSVLGIIQAKLRDTLSDLPEAVYAWIRLKCEEALNMESGHRETREEKLEDCLMGFKEYFEAIGRGEVGPPREKLRTFELILLDEARALLDGIRHSALEAKQEEVT